MKHIYEVFKIKNMQESRIKNYENPHDKHFNEEVIIPTQYLGKVIGKGGSNSKALEEKFLVKMSTQSGGKQQGLETKVVIKGPNQENIKRCKQQIVFFLEPVRVSFP